jgi:hypothetical protein
MREIGLWIIDSRDSGDVPRRHVRDDLLKRGTELGRAVRQVQ